MRTLRSCGPNRSALPPRPRRCQGAGRRGGSTRAQGAGLAGRWPLAAGRWPPGRVSCVPAHGQHGQHGQCVCHVCHCGSMAHMAHTCARVGDVGDVCHHFRFEVARQTWKSYTIHTVIIYSIYIFKRPIHLMTHMTHKRGFSESRITPAPSPTTPPTPTHGVLGFPLV